MTGEKPREIAARLLQERDQGEFLDVLLERAFTRISLRSEDKRFLQELLYGVTRWQLTLDWMIARKTGGKAQKPLVQNLLRLALYQMFWLERVPSYAAVNETVEICKEAGFLPQAKFMNAVLRGYGREIGETRAKLHALRMSDPALGFSHPEWLFRRWEERWGRLLTVQLLEWNNSPPPTYARVNRLKTDRDSLQKIWESEGVEAEGVDYDWAPGGSVFRFGTHPPLARLKSFQEGLFYIQDPSTLLAPAMLEPKPGERVLDMCAAPGGKCTLIAQWMENRGVVAAEDIQPARLKLVEENAARLGATIVSAAPAEKDSVFDRVLLDAPCSNTGVMRRRVDLRWRIKPEEIRRLAATQVGLLKKAAARVRSGGVLVYSTCSIEREENETVVREFLEGHPAFKLEAQRELTPVTDGVDGAYCARLSLAL